MQLAFLLASALTVNWTGDRCTAIIVFDPVIVHSEFRSSRCFAVPYGIRFTRIATFIGSDRGNVLEADVQVHTPEGYYVLQRSEHRETPSRYDAWKSEKLDEPWSEREVCVSVLARPTAGKPVRVQWEVRLNGGR